MKLILFLCASLIAAPVVADPVVVFAAASLKEPIDALAADLGDVVVSYGGSGALARQVLLGGPADVVLLANNTWMHELQTAGVVSDVADFASNSLVLIGPAGSPDVEIADLSQALGTDKLAMGFTQAVPAGIYGHAALLTLSVWDDVVPNVVEVDNVRAVLALVARGEVAFGITYATDAAVSDAVRVVARFDADLHPPIRYTGAVVSGRAEAMAFWAALQGAQGQTVLSDAGFLASVAP
ncbi:MAG: molybdate ABC transporter substrate-binding protein [Yoonia sp.]|nr:molybdate ABC transporter substrate-binding protein [Yoonia sp.]